MMDGEDVKRALATLVLREPTHYTMLSTQAGDGATLNADTRGLNRRLVRIFTILKTYTPFPHATQFSKSSTRRLTSTPNFIQRSIVAQLCAQVYTTSSVIADSDRGIRISFLPCTSYLPTPLACAARSETRATHTLSLPPSKH